MKKACFLMASAILMGGLCFLSSGCSKSDKARSAADANKLQTRTINTKSLDLQEVDINRDGRPDQRIYSKEGEVVFIVRDFNFDDLPDLTEFYEHGEHVRDEIDLDYDGICDLIITYVGDLPTVKEYSTDFEGNRHGIQYFDAQGQRTEIHRDTDRNGTIDLIEYYKPGEDAPYKTEKKTELP